MRIRHVMIFVHDLDAARRFYVDTLGLGLQHDLSDSLGMLVLENEGCILTVHGGHAAHDYREGRKISCAFGVDDLDAEVERLRTAGVPFVGGIHETPVHRYQALLDPSGNLVEVAQYHEDA